MKPIHKIINELVKKYGGNNADIAKKLSEKSEKPISPQRIGQYRGGKKTPGTDFAIVWKAAFGDDLTELASKNETKVSRGTENLTSDMKSTDNKEIPASAKELVYTYLIEQKGHKLIPETLMTDYTMMPNRLIDRHDKDIDRLERENTRLERMLNKAENLVADLEKEIADLRSRVTSKST